MTEIWPRIRDHVTDYRCSDCGHEWNHYEFSRSGPMWRHTDYFGCQKCPSMKFTYLNRDLMDNNSEEYIRERKKWDEQRSFSRRRFAESEEHTK